ncbi:MAG: hypothetical protein ACRYGF_15145 [Janthinobacterium lividum]
MALNSISVSVNRPAVDFVLVAGAQASASSSITISTAVNLSVLSTVKIYAYFASTNALTDAAGDVIPSSLVFGKCVPGVPTSFTAFTQTTPFGSASGLLLFQQGSVLSLGVPLTSVLSLMIDLGGKKNIAAGKYVGTLVIQAQAM